MVTNTYSEERPVVFGVEGISTHTKICINMKNIYEPVEQEYTVSQTTFLRALDEYYRIIIK